MVTDPAIWAEIETPVMWSLLGAIDKVCIDQMRQHPKRHMDVIEDYKSAMVRFLRETKLERWTVDDVVGQRRLIRDINDVLGYADVKVLLWAAKKKTLGDRIFGRKLEPIR